MTIADVPSGDVCLCQVYKNGPGSRNAATQSVYDCHGRQTSRGQSDLLEITLNSGGAHCDERPDLIPDRSVLTAVNGDIIFRSDLLALYSGTFDITSPDQVVLFRGQIELVDRIGTHDKNVSPNCPEPCNPREHIEGWLVGAGHPASPDLTLRALIALRITSRGHDGEVKFEATLNGVFVNCP